MPEIPEHLLKRSAERRKQLGLPTWTSGGRTYQIYNMQTAVDWGSKLAVAAPCVAHGGC